MNIREPRFENPDYISFDLDPSENNSFEDLKDIAMKLATHLRDHGYIPFLKTSGSKGLHIFVPLLPNYTIDECFETSRELAESFIKKNKNTTLQLRKEHRKGRTLIDIYRNRRSQTIISPFSTRARENAPVSMPIPWEMIDELKSSQDFNISNVMEFLTDHGDPWAGIFSYSVPLHTDTKASVLVDPPPGDKHKTPEQLREYASKRDFQGSPEPLPEMATRNGLAFVLHRHNASRLHYDLRLENDGVLNSWALPKGLPERPGIKHLAIATEDHPLEYLNFQGDIPKGAYGGGRMWVFARGKYEIFKQKKNGFYFRLHSPQLNGEYRMHEMKDKEWLLERVDEPVSDWLKNPPKPMLAEQVSKVPSGNEYTFELKWDGIRAIICHDHEGTRIYSRSGRDITQNFPELNQTSFHAYNAVFDAEIVCFDKNGHPDFRKVLSRLNSRKSSPKAYAYIFDLIYLDGKPVDKEPLWKRRSFLEETMKKSGEFYRLSTEEEDGKGLFNAVKERGLEGIMAKKTESVYQPGKRSSDWLKIKVRDTVHVFVVGYTKGDNEREDTFGALHIAEWVDDKLVYRGKVGTGFTDSQLKSIRKNLGTSSPEIREKLDPIPENTKGDTWIEPETEIEVRYASITKKGYYREPVFVGIIK